MNDHRWLTGTRTGVLLEAPEGRPPQLRAWGRAPDPAPDAGTTRGAAAALAPAQTQASVDAALPLDLLPMHATGFQGSPALRGAFLDGTGWAPRLDRVVTTWHERGLDTVADDTSAGLRLHLEVRLDEHDVLHVRAAVTNRRGCDDHDPPATGLPRRTSGLGRSRAAPPTADDFSLDALRITLPVGDRAREVGSFAGRWIREFHLQRQPWLVGRIERVNVRGRSSHEDPPLLLAGSTGFGDESGAVWALHLGWSGNSELRADRTADGYAYLQAAEHLHPGEVVLRPGETYVSPTVYAVASDRGMNGISDAFHAHVRARPNHPRSPRPVTLNTWEAVYFDHDEARLAALADVAADLGIERFVLDDGWFQGRRDDRAGLGDWYVDPGVHPRGLGPLAEHVRARGLQFGLWFEPEMVNPDSELFRDDPTVALTSTGPTTRNQHVLDIARDDIASYLRERLHTLIDDTGAGYLKWDLNRDHVAAEHDGVAASHAHVHALYDLLDELRDRHPGLEIETCSGGGGRIDLGILARTDRVWTSDCNDPIERQRIQRGASLLLPPELLGSHVGPPVAHTTGRNTSLALRLATACFGHLGVEWDLTAASDEERDALRAAIAWYADWREVLHTGRVVRVDHPDDHALVHGVVTPRRGLFSYCQLTSGPWARPATVRMPGFTRQGRYRVELVDLLTDPPAGGRPPAWYADGHVEVSGAHLGDHGIALHAHHPQTVTVVSVAAV